MKIKDLKKQLKNESQSFVPDVKDQVYASVGFSKPLRKSSKFRFNFGLKPALGMMVVLVVSVFLLLQPTAVANSFVIVEINPAIEIEINKEGNVIRVNPLNTDGYFLLENINIQNMNIDDALVRIVDEASAQGYLQTEASKITVSAVNKNKKTEVQVSERVKAVIENHRPGIVENNEALKEEAKELNVSPGKLVIIKKAMEVDSKLTMNQAVKMEIKDLVAIINQSAKQKVDKFENEYKQNLGQMDQALIRDLGDLNQLKEEIQNGLDDLKERIPFDDRDHIIDLVSSRFLEYEFDREDVEDLEDFVDDIEDFYEDYFDFFKDLIEDNYKNQKESYKNKVNENAKNEVDDFTFELKDKYWFLDYNNRYTKEEKEVIRIINQIQGLMSNKSPGVFRKIQKLYEEYLDELEDLDDDFKNKDIVIGFESTYQEFVKNIGKNNGEGSGKNNGQGNKK